MALADVTFPLSGLFQFSRLSLVVEILPNFTPHALHALDVDSAVVESWEVVDRQKIKCLQNAFKAEYLWTPLIALLWREIKRH